MTLGTGFVEGTTYYTAKLNADLTAAPNAAMKDDASFEAVAADATWNTDTPYYVKNAESGAYAEAADSDFEAIFPDGKTGVFESDTQLDAGGLKTQNGPVAVTGDKPVDGKFYYTKATAAEKAEAKAATVTVELNKAFLNSFLENGKFVRKSVTVTVE